MPTVKTPWLSLLAECMPLYRETKKKVIGGIVAGSIGYQWPSHPFFEGGTLPFVVPVRILDYTNWVRVVHTLSQTLSRYLTHFTVHECECYLECYLNGYFQAINLFWNYYGTELQLPRNIALPFRGVSMVLNDDIGMPSTTSKCYGICPNRERMSVFRLNGDHRD